MRLSELAFKPKYDTIEVVDGFRITLQKMTKPELTKIIRDTITMVNGEPNIKTKVIKTPTDRIEVSALAVELAKKIVGWEGLNGRVLKEIMPDIEFDIDDEEEFDFDKDGAIMLVAYGSVPDEDGRRVSFEDFLINKINSLVGNLEEEVVHLEKK